MRRPPHPCRFGSQGRYLVLVRTGKTLDGRYRPTLENDSASHSQGPDSRGNQIGENLLFKTLVIRVEQVERRLNYIEMKAMTPRCFEHIQVNVWIFCAR